MQSVRQHLVISIHAPLRERRRKRTADAGSHEFQSTLPYGSDIHGRANRLFKKYFNPRSLTGATSCASLLFYWSFRISIHAPLRERHMTMINLYPVIAISIHAPLRERLRTWNLCSRDLHFNPRSLTGATLRMPMQVVTRLFQSTLPYGSDLLLLKV